MHDNRVTGHFIALDIPIVIIYIILTVTVIPTVILNPTVIIFIPTAILILLFLCLLLFLLLTLPSFVPSDHQYAGLDAPGMLSS